jgi:hypothetical protein
MHRSLRFLPVIVAGLLVLLLPVSAASLDAPKVYTDSVVLSGTGCHDYAVYWRLPRHAHGVSLVSPPKGTQVKDAAGETSARIKGDFRKRKSGKKLVGIRYSGTKRQCRGKGGPDHWRSNSIGLHVRFKRFRHVYAKFASIRQHAPEIFYFGASQRIFGMNWTSWDGRQAYGRGTYPVNDCIPYCAAGHLTNYPTAIKLSEPHNCGGTWFYSRFSYDTSGGPDGVSSIGGCRYLNGSERIRGPEVVSRSLTKRRLG